MNPEPRELTVTAERRSEATVLRVEGPVDHVQYFKLEEAIQDELDRRQTRLVIDLTGLTYMVSAGINTLGHALAQFERVGGRLALVRPARIEKWHFFVTIGVDQLFPWAGSVEEALRKVSAPP
jgi:anti-anti-sigma factor